MTRKGFSSKSINQPELAVRHWESGLSPGSIRIPLGPWCLSSDFTVSDDEKYILYHWADRAKAHKDHEYLRKVASEVLKPLADRLNQLHQTNYSYRAWDVMLGHWLIQFLTVVFDRVSQLELVAGSEEKFFAVSSGEVQPPHPPLSPQEASRLFVDDDWNELFIGELIHLFFPRITVVPQSKVSAQVGGLVPRLRSSLMARVKRLLLWVLQRAIDFFFYFSDQPRTVVFSNTSLTPLRTLRLVFSIGCRVVVNPFVPEVAQSEFDPDQRKWSISPVASTNSLFEQAVSTLVPKYLPVCLVEGFKELELAAFKAFPGRCDAMFTSSDHISTMPFKVWAASQIDRGSLLVVGQHGGGAAHRFNASVAWEEAVSDFYLVSGPGLASDAKHRVAGQYWSKVRTRKRASKGPALLVTGAMPPFVHELRSMPLAGEVRSHLRGEMALMAELPPSIVEDFRVRLYPKVDFGWELKRRWLRRFPSYLFDSGSRSFSRAVDGCRLVVVTYQASTYAEVIAANYPTVLCWDSSLWEASNSSEPIFSWLQEVGIFHSSPQSAASHITKIWDDIELWWQSPEVQQARKAFCDLYAVRDHNPTARLRQILPAVASEARDQGLSSKYNNSNLFL